MIYYGLKDREHLNSCVSKAVRVFGGGHKAQQALIEITAVETHCGTFPDRHPEKLGVGVTQFDQIGFDDVVSRIRKKHKRKLEQEYGVNLKTLELDDLAYNPEIAVAFARLKYLLRPEPIPMTVEGRASYWKRFYNSALGDGTEQDYIERVAEYV